MPAREKDRKTTSSKPATARRATLHRKTRETDIQLFLDLDGHGAAEISTGVGFLDHMLTSLATHARFDLTIVCKGDLDIDPHHSVEDVAIVLGDALNHALSERRGITRFGHAYVPLDEALARCVVDLSGRAFLSYEVELPVAEVGTLPTELLEDFFRAFADHGRFTLHADLVRGRNGHHIAEALFKSLARALGTAVALDPRSSGVPSTKGVL
jgi:imidazoleglycerol-phosphate dehydratase